jgi:stage V sporulation protein K
MNRKEDDDFETLLMKMMNDFDAEVANEDEKTSEEAEKEAEKEEEDKGEDDDWCSDDFPQGTVEFNENNKVNVEILKPVRHPRQELKKLVGCRNIKTQIKDLLELTTYNAWMLLRQPHWKCHEVSLHAIFFGRPGTGKTTVCKIYGALLRETGSLSKGHVVVCNRSTFLGSNWGDEERAVRQVLEMAKGGVLMIDEAYMLNSSHPNDPGKLILPMLMDILANEQQRDIAIVLCGYKDPLQQLLELNAGLASRFPNRFEFTDFTVDELLEITRRRVEEFKYHFTPKAWMKYKTLLSEAYAVRNVDSWGNARYVANFLEHIYLTHAKRCMRKRHLKVDQCLSLTTADIQPIEVPKAKPKVGL